MGENTPGKRSPDGRFREYKYNREIARAVVEHLQLRGYDAQLLVPEEEDISLEERVRRANKLSCQIGHPIQETIIISIHVDGIIDFIQQGPTSQIYDSSLSIYFCKFILFQFLIRLYIYFVIFVK